MNTSLPPVTNLVLNLGSLAPYVSRWNSRTVIVLVCVVGFAAIVIARFYRNSAAAPIQLVDSIIFIDFGNEPTSNLIYSFILRCSKENKLFFEQRKDVATESLMFFVPHMPLGKTIKIEVERYFKTASGDQSMASRKLSMELKVDKNIRLYKIGRESNHLVCNGSTHLGSEQRTTFKFGAPPFISSLESFTIEDKKLDISHTQGVRDGFLIINKSPNLCVLQLHIICQSITDANLAGPLHIVIQPNEEKVFSLEEINNRWKTIYFKNTGRAPPENIDLKLDNAELKVYSGRVY